MHHQFNNSIREKFLHQRHVPMERSILISETVIWEECIIESGKRGTFSGHFYHVLNFVIDSAFSSLLRKEYGRNSIYLVLLNQLAWPMGCSGGPTQGVVFSGYPQHVPCWDYVFPWISKYTSIQNILSSIKINKRQRKYPGCLTKPLR